MTPGQFKAWLKVKLDNLAGVCGSDSAKPEKLLSRLVDILSEAEARALTVRKGDATAGQRHRKIRTLRDCNCVEGTPKCFHCQEPMSKNTPAELNGNHVVAVCLSCGCMTPFQVAE